MISTVQHDICCNVKFVVLENFVMMCNNNRAMIVILARKGWDSIINIKKQQLPVTTLSTYIYNSLRKQQIATNN